MLGERGHKIPKNQDIFASCHDIIIKTLLSAEAPIVDELNRLGNR